MIEEGTLKYTVVRDGSCCKDGIVETNGGILMLVRDMQPLNAALLNVDTESGMVMVVRVLQLAKAWFAIVVTEEGCSNVTEASPEQLLNVASSVVTDGGILIDGRLLQPENAI